MFKTVFKMSRRHRSRCVLDRLTRIAGSPALVQTALISLRRAGREPTLGEVIDYLLAHRDEWHGRVRRTERASAVGARALAAATFHVSVKGEWPMTLRA